MRSLPLVSAFTLLVALASPTASAQSEEKCLGIGKFAEAAANLLRLGQTEERVLTDMLKPTASSTNRPKAQQALLDERDIAVINWVYTVRPSAQDARAIVYAKCMSGGLGNIDMKKYRAAGQIKDR